MAGYVKRLKTADIEPLLTAGRVYELLPEDVKEAKSAADTAKSRADAAYSRADTGVSNAAKAQSTANTAVSNAEIAKSRADTAYNRAAPGGHVHTSAQVGSAIAGLGIGSVGSHALLFNTVVEYLLPGAIKSGSYLRYASTYTGSAGEEGGGTIAPPGTWICMGADGAGNRIDTYTNDNTSTTIWKRIE